MLKSKSSIRKVSFLLIVFILCIFSFSSIVNAAPAPPVTQFEIIGFSWPALWNQGYYYSADYASQVSVPSTNAYLIIYQMGYGSIGSSRSYTVVQSYPITDSGNIIVGWYKVLSFSNLSSGYNTFQLSCTSYNSPWNTIYDSISLNIQP